MKRQLFAGLVSLALAHAALGSTLPGYTNNAVVVSPPADPPQIDAYNFVNNATFFIGASLYTLPYATANTTNFINRASLGSDTGFRFDTFDTSQQQNRWAASFLNTSTGTIDCGTSTNLILIGQLSGAECLIAATNVTQQGTINLGPDSLCMIQGQNVDLSGGLINMEGFSSGLGLQVTGNGALLTSSGIFDGYWGVGTTKMNPAAQFTQNYAQTPAHWVTNRQYLNYQQYLSLPGATPYVNDVMTGPSNRTVQAVFILNTNSTFINRVYFFGGEAAVEWNWAWTNIVTGQPVQDYLYLLDDIGLQTNLVVRTNGTAAPSTGFNWSYSPTNYYFSRGGPFFFGNAATPGLPAGTFANGTITNDYAAYEAIFLPYTFIPAEVADQTVTTWPGRTEITADNLLTLDVSRISSLNYLLLRATNHFTTSGETAVVAPYADFDLHTTNGVLVFTNLLAPVVPRLQGAVDVWSARWTTVSTNGLTNDFTVLLVDSQLSPSATPQINSLKLGSTNVFIGDLLNVTSNLVIDAIGLTITTNGPGAATPSGTLNLLSGDILGPLSFPRLQYLTNFGTIQNYNLASFRGDRSPPYFPTAFSEPYRAFVNHGNILNDGCQIWADYLFNDGLLFASGSSIDLQARTAVLRNGSILAPSGDLTISSGSLQVRNQPLQVGRQLTLNITNSLTDTGSFGGNIWTVGNGFSLLTLPPVASLLGTTITSTIPAFARVTSQWAGQDLGPSAAGYANNAALGRLILDGGPSSKFIFQGSGSSNAIYVDYLELRDSATNRDSGGNLSTLQINPGFKIYYAQAAFAGTTALVVGGITNYVPYSVPVADKLNHKNGGALNWVSSYAGRYSSTNIVYPDGTTNTFNLALTQDCNWDSNNNGIPNCSDQYPFFVPSQLLFRLDLTNAPAPTALLSWQTIRSEPLTGNYVTNSLFYKSSLSATNWQLLTNFVSGPVSGRVAVADAVGATNRFYRVRLDTAQP